MNHLYLVHVNGRYYIFQNAGGYDGARPDLALQEDEIKKLVYKGLYGREPNETGDNNPPLSLIFITPIGQADLTQITVETKIQTLLIAKDNIVRSPSHEEPPETA